MHEELRLALHQRLVSERLEADLVQGIAGVGDQLTQEDLLVGVEGVDDQTQQLRNGSKETSDALHDRAATEGAPGFACDPAKRVPSLLRTKVIICALK